MTGEVRRKFAVKYGNLHLCTPYEVRRQGITGSVTYTFLNSLTIAVPLAISLPWLVEAKGPRRFHAPGYFSA